MSIYSIMVIDDESETLEYLKKNLSISGYDNVDIFSNPLEAIEAFKETKYHIVLTDLEMPELDGICVLKRIREYDPLTQMIVIAESTSIEKILACLESGANDYISKPFKSMDYVLEIIESSVKKLDRWRQTIRESIK